MPLWDRNRSRFGRPLAMKIEILRAKLHQACITQADVDYEGSLGIDIELMEAVGMYPYEKVLVANINNGSRLETYAIPEPFGSRRVVLHRPAPPPPRPPRPGRVGPRRPPPPPRLRRRPHHRHVFLLA